MWNSACTITQRKITSHVANYVWQRSCSKASYDENPENKEVYLMLELYDKNTNKCSLLYYRMLNVGQSQFQIDGVTCSKLWLTLYDSSLNYQHAMPCIISSCCSNYHTHKTHYVPPYDYFYHNCKDNSGQQRPASCNWTCNTISR